MNNSATIVTAYYELNKKKHTTSNYYKWINNFMKLDSYMIIYTGDEESYKNLLEMRKGFENKTRIVILKFNDLYCNKFNDYWKKDFLRDHEKYHDPALYIIWNEKTAFIKKAKILNPFNTDYYCWADIGMVRDDIYLEYIKTFPSSKMLNIIDKEKVYLLNLEPYTEYEKTSIKDACENFRYKNNTGAGVIMCHIDIIDKWYDTYYNMLDRFIELDLFAGKDQSIINCICLIYPDIVKLIKPLCSPIDKWFYMLFYFSDCYYDNFTHIQ